MVRARIKINNNSCSFHFIHFFFISFSFKIIFYILFMDSKKRFFFVCLLWAPTSKVWIKNWLSWPSHATVKAIEYSSSSENNLYFFHVTMLKVLFDLILLIRVEREREIWKIFQWCLKSSSLKFFKINFSSFHHWWRSPPNHWNSIVILISPRSSKRTFTSSFSFFVVDVVCWRHRIVNVEIENSFSYIFFSSSFPTIDKLEKFILSKIKTFIVDRNFYFIDALTAWTEMTTTKNFYNVPATLTREFWNLLQWNSVITCDHLSFIDQKDININKNKSFVNVS
jgi:hypothetical protein